MYLSLHVYDYTISWKLFRPSKKNKLVILKEVKGHKFVTCKLKKFFIIYFISGFLYPSNIVKSQIMDLLFVYVLYLGYVSCLLLIVHCILFLFLYSLLDLSSFSFCKDIYIRSIYKVIREFSSLLNFWVWHLTRCTTWSSGITDTGGVFLSVLLLIV